MKILFNETYEEVSQTVASLTLAAFYQNKRVNVDLTDGSSPKRAYEIMASILQKYPDRLRNVHIYQHDEVEGETQTVYNTLQKQIHIPFGFPKEHIHQMKFDGYKEYIQKIETDGGLDYMLLGLGADGHFCANFPISTQFDKEIYVYHPIEYPWYKDYCKALQTDDLPSIVTFGFPALLKTKQVVVVVNGKQKAQAVKDILTKPISIDCPGTILRLHPNLILVLDKDAASLL